MDRDIRAAIDLLNERGFKRIVCMGASMGGTTCLKGAVDRELAGVAVIASSISLGGSNKVSFQDLSELTTPKLFICAQDDTVNGRATGLASAITTMYKRSAEPKEIRIFPGTAHGTDLFDTESGDEFRDLLVNFLEGLR